MATYVAEFVILNEIVDFRDICEGSTDDTSPRFLCRPTAFFDLLERLQQVEKCRRTAEESRTKMTPL